MPVLSGSVVQIVPAKVFFLGNRLQKAPKGSKKTHSLKKSGYLVCLPPIKIQNSKILPCSPLLSPLPPVQKFKIRFPCSGCPLLGCFDSFFRGPKNLAKPSRT